MSIEGDTNAPEETKVPLADNWKATGLREERDGSTYNEASGRPAH